MAPVNRSLPFLLLVTATGCTAPVEEVERTAVARSTITVEEAVTAGCSTSQIAALSVQIIGQGNCIEPGAFSELIPTANVTFGSAVLPYLEEPARDALAAALDENPGTAMQINSMLRTVAQQYLLYQWYLAGTCGIGLAASPGSSNHETGLAIDIQQYDTWRTILEAKGFSWLGAGDPVHFDYEGPGAIDHRDLGVMAFQQLWNENHPEDVIDEDGIYGPMTEARIEASPAEGFPLGPTCAPPGEAVLGITAEIVGASDRFADGPSAGITDLVEGQAYELAVTVQNTGPTAATGVTLTVTGDDAVVAEETAVAIGDIEPGSAADVVVALSAAQYSVSGDEPAGLTLDVGDVSLDVALDVYSDRRWEWDGDRLEGWEAVGDGSLELTESALRIEANGSARSPAIDVPADTVAAARITGSAAAPATLIVVTDAGEQLENLDLSGGEALIALALSGRILALRIDASSDTEIDSLRLEAEADLGDVPPPEDAATGCSCRLGGEEHAPAGWLWLAGLGLVFSRRRA